MQEDNYRLEDRIRVLEERVRKLENTINPKSAPRPVTRIDKLYEVHSSASRYGMMVFSLFCGDERGAVYLTDKLVEFLEKVYPQLPEEYKNRPNT